MPKVKSRKSNTSQHGTQKKIISNEIDNINSIIGGVCKNLNNTAYGAARQGLVKSNVSLHYKHDGRTILEYAWLGAKSTYLKQLNALTKLIKLIQSDSSKQQELLYILQKIYNAKSTNSSICIKTYPGFEKLWSLKLTDCLKQLKLSDALEKLSTVEITDPSEHLRKFNNFLSMILRIRQDKGEKETFLEELKEAMNTSSGEIADLENIINNGEYLSQIIARGYKQLVVLIFNQNPNIIQNLSSEIKDKAKEIIKDLGFNELAASVDKSYPTTGYNFHILTLENPDDVIKHFCKNFNTISYDVLDLRINNPVLLADVKDRVESKILEHQQLNDDYLKFYKYLLSSISCVENNLTSLVNNLIDDCGNTLLHNAVKANDHYKITVLINAGAKIDVKNNDGLTPIGCAILIDMYLNLVNFILGEFLHYKNGKNLLEEGLNEAKGLICPQQINFKEEGTNFTPLMDALNRGLTYTAFLFIYAGADISNTKNQWEETALDMAKRLAEEAEISSLEWLINYMNKLAEYRTANQNYTEGLETNGITHQNPLDTSITGESGTVSGCNS